MQRAHRVLTCLLVASGAFAASPRDRMLGVASYAQNHQANGPDFVAVGVLAVVGLIALALFGAAVRDETQRVKVKRRRR